MIPKFPQKNKMHRISIEEIRKIELEMLICVGDFFPDNDILYSNFHA